MNYRHAYHAGNHTEIFKHAALTIVLERLLQKPQPIVVIDTHAGIGVYDLRSEEANRTAEKQTGIARIFGRDLPSAPTYVNLLKAMNGKTLTLYPGSPEIIRNLLRDGDRLIGCELHPDDGLQLKERYKRDHRVSVHQRSGYEAIRALLPPHGRRGLVFIDPPFEQRDETTQLCDALREGLKRWPTGIFLAWYPIKDSAVGESLSRTVVSTGLPKALRVEFLPYARDGVRLAGSGIIICNTPWTVDQRLKALCGELVPLLGDSNNSTWSVEWLTAQ